MPPSRENASSLAGQHAEKRLGLQVRFHLEKFRCHGGPTRGNPCATYPYPLYRGLRLTALYQPGGFAAIRSGEPHDTLRSAATMWLPEFCGIPHGESDSISSLQPLSNCCPVIMRATTARGSFCPSDERGPFRSTVDTLCRSYRSSRAARNPRAIIVTIAAQVSRSFMVGNLCLSFRELGNTK